MGWVAWLMQSVSYGLQQGAITLAGGARVCACRTVTGSIPPWPYPPAAEAYYSGRAGPP
jgi:hypothetical protein